MATMFRDFSFDPPSSPAYSLYEADRAAMNVSPTSRAMEAHHLPNRPPTPPCTMGDLAVQLNQQSLRIDTNVTLNCYPSAPLTPESDRDESIAPTEPRRAQQERPTYSRVSASLLRMQRQSNARLQCSAAHIRDISKLVKMIDEEKQCTVNDSISRTSSTCTTAASPCTASEDEGVDMEYDTASPDMEALVGMPAWRAGDRRDSCIRVTKPVRMRKRSKENGVSKRRST
jgi:hypothetical protein